MPYPLSPLDTAILTGNCFTIRKLIEDGAEVMQPSPVFPSGDSRLLHLLSNGDSEIVSGVCAGTI